MLKKSLILLYLFITTLFANAAQKVSGHDFLNRPLVYETNDIISYGKIVIGKTNSNNFTDNSSKKYRNNSEYIYFCGLKELYRFNSTDIYYKDNGEFESSTTTKSSNETMPIALEKTNELTHKLMGTKIFTSDLEIKCSNVIKKFPRLEIPFARGVTTIDHIVLDTYNQNKNIRSAWIKQSFMLSEKILDSNNKPIQIDGSDFIKYTIDKTKGYKMFNNFVDCDKETIGTSEVIEYSVNGEVLRSSRNNSKSLSMDPIVPNTVGELTKIFLCKI
jgi:hypothetical protein